MKKIKKSVIGLLFSLVFIGLVQTQQMDIYREIGRSQQQIMTVYKYLLTEYVHELNISELTSRIIDSMLQNFDPYTEYYEAKDIEDLTIKTEGEFSGVGLEIYMYEDQLTVVGPIEGSPASRSGIYTGDAIIKIDGEPTEGLELKDATAKIRGEKGTDVILTIRKPITEQVQDYTITRDVIAIKDIPYYGMVDSNIGYLRLTNFSLNTGKETFDAMTDLINQGAQNIVLDLRDNPGGLLSASLEILDLFFEKNLELVSTKGRNGKSIKSYKSLNNAVIPQEIDLVVLINGGTASASEIVAGVLQDYDRAVVIGDQSFGKGLVQTVLGINQDTALKITNSKYYIPSGRSIQKQKFIDEELIADKDAVSDSLFTTKRGRTVSGSGGITPDILIKDDGSYPLAASALREGAFFRYVQTHTDKYQSFDEVTADGELLNNFSDYLSENKIYGYIEGEDDLKLAKEKLAKLSEEKNIFINNAFNVIENQIKKNQEIMFEDEKDLIQRMLLGEFAFYFDSYKGRYELYLKNDIVLEEAKQVLLDDNKYSSILSTSEKSDVALSLN